MINQANHDKLTMSTTALPADSRKEENELNQQQFTALYCRLSNEDDLDGESNSIQNQRTLLQKYAEDHGFRNIRFFVDDGYTGTNFNRPAMQEMLSLVEKYVDIPKLTTVIVNEFIKKIIVHEADKSSGKRRQTIEIIFNFVGQVDIPVLTAPVVTESSTKQKKTA